MKNTTKNFLAIVSETCLKVTGFAPYDKDEMLKVVRVAADIAVPEAAWVTRREGTARFDTFTATQICKHLINGWSEWDAPLTAHQWQVACGKAVNLIFRA